MNTDSLMSDISRFLEDKEAFLTSVLGELGLPKATIDQPGSGTLLDLTDETVCPVDPGHTLPKAQLADHADMCLWRKKGYTVEEVRAAAPVASYKGSKTVVVVDMKQHYGDKHPFLPDLSPFDTAQRLAHYDHVISVARQSRTCEGITHENISTLLTGGEKKEERGAEPKTGAAMLREQRDYKRRRQTYRAKGVSTNRKSRTEVMREVIQNQMEFFQQNIGFEPPLTSTTASPLRDGEKSRISSTVTSNTRSPATENPERRHKEKKRKHKRESRSRSRDKKKSKKSKKKKKKSKSSSEEGELDD